MIGLLQRVSSAAVLVDNRAIAEIGQGLLVLVAVERGDTETEAERLLERLLNYRVFPDTDDRMNCSVRDVSGDLLLVPQFTLAADTAKGNRASFVPAAPPDEGRRLFERLCELARHSWPRSRFGEFGATMQVRLCNEGPVTFSLQVPPKNRATS